MFDVNLDGEIVLKMGLMEPQAVLSWQVRVEGGGHASINKCLKKNLNRGYLQGL